MVRNLAFAMLAACTLVGAEDPAPAFPAGAQILFQGDSITDENRGRTTDPNHILGHSYVFLIAAKYGAMLPDRNLCFSIAGSAAIRFPTLPRAGRWIRSTSSRTF